MSDKEEVAKTEIPALTGIRALAAYLVFAHHYTAEPYLPNLSVWENILHQGYIGVSIFFTLSGFLITYRYEGNLSRRTLGQYFWNRFCRIYPLYFLLSLVTFAYENTWGLRTIFYNLTLLKGFSINWTFTGIGQSWSLTVEECFYAAAPIIWLLSRRIGLAGVTLAIYGVGIALFWFGSWISCDGFFMGIRLFTGYTFFGRCFDFIVGVFLARLWRDRQSTGNVSPKRTESSLSFTNLGLLGIFSIMVFFSNTHEMGIFDSTGLPVHNFLLPIMTAILFWGLLTEITILGRLLGSSVGRLLGRSSYAFYLVHAGLLQIYYLNPIFGAGWQYPRMAQFVAYNLIAIALYLLIEMPIHRFLKKLVVFSK